MLLGNTVKYSLENGILFSFTRFEQYAICVEYSFEYLVILLEIASSLIKSTSRCGFVKTFIELHSQFVKAEWNSLVIVVINK